MDVKVIVCETERGGYRAEVPLIPICIIECENLAQLQFSLREMLREQLPSLFDGDELKLKLLSPIEFARCCEGIRQLPNSDLLDALINNMPDLIYVKDVESRFVLCNQCCARSLGVDSTGGVIGKQDFDLHPLDKARIYYSDEQKIMLTGQAMIGHEEPVIYPDGTERWYSSSKVPFVDRNGEVIGLIGIGRDITVQKRNEEQLRQAIQIFKETQIQLIEAEKFKCVGRLAAGVAHEVKNPLAVLSMGLEYLQGQVQGHSDLMEVMGDMRKAVEHANEVISQLLDFTTPLEKSMQVGDINTVIRHVLSLMEHDLDDALITVRSEMDDRLPRIRFDASKIERVFVNLFLNAIAAMPKGGELAVRTLTQRMKTTGANVASELSSRFHIGESMVVVYVEDSGPGIRSKDIDRLFDPFFSTKPTGAGVGLGLSMARDIVGAHQGIIKINNRPDIAGAQVVLYFPVASE